MVITATRWTLLLTALLTLAGCAGRTGPIDAIKKTFKDAFEPMFPPTPSEAAQDAFNVYDPDARRQSIALLSAAKFGGEEPYQKMYRLLIDDQDATVRATCVTALGMHGTLEDAALVIPRLEDQVSFVRWEAAKALQKIHHPDAVGPLIQALRKDPDEDVRMAAAKALGQYPQRRVYQALVGALDDPIYSVAQTAQESLCLLTGKDYGQDGASWLTWAQGDHQGLFEGQQPYVWHPYDKPDTFVDKLQFWKDDSPPEPQRPRGLQPTNTGDDAEVTAAATP